MQNSICYLLVHWMNFELTCNCIDYLLNLSGDNYSIVCVDNGSTNGTGKKLCDKYSANKNVYIVLNPDDPGYAMGINYGYAFIRNSLDINPDCIVTINNDTFIEDPQFNEKLLCVLEGNHSDVLAPDIRVGDNGRHQNPLRVEPRSNLNLVISLLYNGFMYLLSYVPIICNFIGNKFKNKMNVINQYEELKKFNYSDFCPHGACIIYNERWIRNEKILYVPGTFLFGDEEILYDYIKKKQYRISFIPELSVHHLGDATIGREVSLKKIRFLYKCGFNTAKLQLKLRMRAEK